jgi:hypothetical protein
MAGKATGLKDDIWRLGGGYEKLHALFNLMKVAKPDMYYKYISKPNKWKDGRHIFFRIFWCFPPCVEAFRHYPPILSIDGTFLIGKYEGTVLIAIVVDADNVLFLWPLVWWRGRTKLVRDGSCG